MHSEHSLKIAHLILQRRIDIGGKKTSFPVDAVSFMWHEMAALSLRQGQRLSDFASGFSLQGITWLR
jgi:hypothetical protein